MATNQLTQIINMANKPNTYLALVHKTDGNVVFKALKQHKFFPERLIEFQTKAGMNLETRDDQLYITPDAHQVQYVHGSNVRVIHYIEGFVQSVSPEMVGYYNDLLNVVGKYEISKGVSLPILLFDTIDTKLSAEENLLKMNAGFSEGSGISLDYTLDDAEKYLALKKELLKDKPEVFNQCRYMLMQNEENSSVTMQNIISRSLALEHEKNGRGALGILFENGNLTKVLIAGALGLVLILSQM